MKPIHNGFSAKGGKTALLPVLAPLIQHFAYQNKLINLLDVFGGGGKIALSTELYPYFRRIVYNEYERSLSALFWCLKQKKAKQLYAAFCNLLQYPDQRQLFCMLKECKDRDDLNLYLAGAFALYIIYTSYQSNRQSYYAGAEERLKSGFLYDKLSQMALFSDKLDVCNMDGIDLIRKNISDPKVLIYCDPPYFNTKAYKNDWSAEDHLKFAHLLIRSQPKGVVIVSGYRDDQGIYQQLEDNGWDCMLAGIIPVTSSINHIGGTHKARLAMEWVWCNHPIPDYIKLLAQQFDYERKSRRENVR